MDNINEVLFDETALASTASPEDQEKIKNYIRTFNAQLTLLLSPIGRITWIDGKLGNIVKNPDEELLAIIRQKEPDAKPDENGEIGVMGFQISKAAFPNEVAFPHEHWDNDFDTWIKALNIDRRDDDPHGFLDDYLKMTLVRIWLLRACEKGHSKIIGWADDVGPLFQITEKGTQNEQSSHYPKGTIT